MMDFSSTRITVIGDVISDEWVSGRIDRLSPEGPWPVFVYESTTRNDGGAANVAANLAALGCPATLVRPMRTSIKQRYVVGRHQVFRVDIEKLTRLRLEEEDALLQQVQNSRPQVLVLSDYGKGCFAGDLAERCIKWANENGVATVVDPKGDWKRYHSATVITPNVHEIPPGNPYDLIRRHDLAAVLRTEGERGMTLFQRAFSPIHIDAQGPNVVDVVGAGDTVVAALALGMACFSGRPLAEAARMANAAAGVVVGKAGTATCSWDELRSAYSGKPAVGLANGAFDILHPGHVNLLQEAASHVERLIVAVNSDESIRRLKGPSRPINDLPTRVLMLKALSCVHKVEVFDTEDDLRSIIRREKANILFKGRDYAGRRVTGDDIADRVVLIDTSWKSSTDGELAKLKALGKWEELA